MWQRPPGAQHLGSIDPDRIGSMTGNAVFLMRRARRLHRPWRRSFWRPQVWTWNNVDPLRLTAGRGVFVGRYYTSAALRWWAPWDRIAARRDLELCDREEHAYRVRVYGPPHYGEPECV
jgi:hypothetical protein